MIRKRPVMGTLFILLLSPPLWASQKNQKSEGQERDIPTLLGDRDEAPAEGEGAAHPTDQMMQDYFKRQQEAWNQSMDQLFDRDFFGGKNPFEEMRKMQQQMMRQFEDYESDSAPPEKSQANPQAKEDQKKKPGVFSRLWNSWFEDRFGGGDLGDIQKREDPGAVYYEIQIKNMKNEKIDVKAEGGMLTVRGQTIDKGKYLTSSKSFQRSFPLPSNIEEQQMSMEQKGDKLVLKFPKKTI